MLKVGFIGLGNVGGKLAGSLLRNGIDLTVRDLDREIAQPFLERGAKWADSPREMAQNVDVLITCLPSPAASAMVMEAPDGALAGLGPGKIWAEMSTTDKDEVLRLGEKVRAAGAEPVRAQRIDDDEDDVGTPRRGVAAAEARRQQDACRHATAAAPRAPHRLAAASI